MVTDVDCLYKADQLVFADYLGHLSERVGTLIESLIIESKVGRTSLHHQGPLSLPTGLACPAIFGPSYFTYLPW